MAIQTNPTYKDVIQGNIIEIPVFYVEQNSDDFPAGKSFGDKFGYSKSGNKISGPLYDYTLDELLNVIGTNQEVTKDPTTGEWKFTEKLNKKTGYSVINYTPLDMVFDFDVELNKKGVKNETIVVNDKSPQYFSKGIMIFDKNNIKIVNNNGDANVTNSTFNLDKFIYGEYLLDESNNPSNKLGTFAGKTIYDIIDNEGRGYDSDPSGILKLIGQYAHYFYENKHNESLRNPIKADGGNLVKYFGEKASVLSNAFGPTENNNISGKVEGIGVFSSLGEVVLDIYKLLIYDIENGRYNSDIFDTNYKKLINDGTIGGKLLKEIHNLVENKLLDISKLCTIYSKEKNSSNNNDVIYRISTITRSEKVQVSFRDSLQKFGTDDKRLGSVEFVLMLGEDISRNNNPIEESKYYTTSDKKKYANYLGVSTNNIENSNSSAQEIVGKIKDTGFDLKNVYLKIKLYFVPENMVEDMLNSYGKDDWIKTNSAVYQYIDNEPWFWGVYAYESKNNTALIDNAYTNFVVPEIMSATEIEQNVILHSNALWTSGRFNKINVFTTKKHWVNPILTVDSHSEEITAASYKTAESRRLSMFKELYFCAAESPMNINGKNYNFQIRYENSIDKGAGNSSITLNDAIAKGLPFKDEKFYIFTKYKGDLTEDLKKTIVRGYLEKYYYYMHLTGRGLLLDAKSLPNSNDVTMKTGGSSDVNLGRTVPDFEKKLDKIRSTIIAKRLPKVYPELFEESVFRLFPMYANGLLNANDTFKVFEDSKKYLVDASKKGNMHTLNIEKMFKYMFTAFGNGGKYKKDQTNSEFTRIDFPNNGDKIDYFDDFEVIHPTIEDDYWSQSTGGPTTNINFPIIVTNLKAETTISLDEALGVKYRPIIDRVFSRLVSPKNRLDISNIDFKELTLYQFATALGMCLHVFTLKNIPNNDPANPYKDAEHTEVVKYFNDKIRDGYTPLPPSGGFLKYIKGQEKVVGHDITGLGAANKIEFMLNGYKFVVYDAFGHVVEA